MLLLSSRIKSGDKSVAHAAVGLTSLLSVMTGVLFSKAIAPSEKARQKFKPEVRQRRADVFGLMTLTGIAAVGVYVAGFIQKRKQAESKG